jgi:hypothetical protein
MPIEGKIIPMDDAARVAELDSVVGCDFDVAQISKLRSTDSDCQLVQPPAACVGDHSRTGGSKMTTPDQTDSRLWCGCSRQPIPKTGKGISTTFA